MGFQDVEFLLSRASFPPHFLSIVVVVNALGPPHVIDLWLGCKHGHDPCEILLLRQCLFFVSVEFHGDHKTVIKLR